MNNLSEETLILDFKKIAKIQNLYMQIFEEEDNYYPDYRIIRPKERAIERYLNQLTTNKEKQNEIYNIITQQTWNNTDYTFRPICNALREKGYKIINN